MEYLRFSFLDYLLFGSMFAISCALGIYFGCKKKKETAVDYLLGGNKMQTFPTTISLAASVISGITLIGIPADSYLHGTQFAMSFFSIMVVGVINNFTFLPLFHKLRLQSVYQYLELRYGKDVKNIATGFYILSNILYLPLVIYAPSICLNQVTGINIYTISWILSVVCIFYTAIGGLKAVVWTDTLQFAVTFAILLYLLSKGIIISGGVSQIWSTSTHGERIELFNMNADPTIRSTFWTVFIGNIFAWTSLFNIDPASVQRFLSLPSLKNAQKASIVAITVIAFTKLFTCIFGLLIYTKYAYCDPLSMGYIQKADQLFPYYVMDVAKDISGIGGLFVAGLFTTSLSTFSTCLNTVSGTLYSDFIALLLPERLSENKESIILKIIAFVLGITCATLIFAVAQLGSVFELLYCAYGITGGPVLGVFTLGIFFPVANRKGALLGMLLSVALMSFIIIQNQMHILNGSIKDITKPLRTDGCNFTHFNETSHEVITTISSATSNTEEALWLYKISFHYYHMIGTFFTVIIGLAVSFVTKHTTDVTPDLIIPCMRRFIKSRADDAKVVQDQKPNVVIYRFTNGDNT